MKFSRALASLTCCVSLTACSAGYDAAMKIENPKKAPIVMIGSFEGSVALINGDPKNAKIIVSNGNVECIGVSNSGKFSTDFSKNVIKHQFEISCNDGRSGNAVATITARPEGYGVGINGVGVGTLNDGSEIRLVFGEMSGSLGW